VKVEDEEFRLGAVSRSSQLLHNCIEVLVVCNHCVTLVLVALFVAVVLGTARSAAKWAQVGHHHLLNSQFVNPLQFCFEIISHILDLLQNLLLKK